MNIRSNSPRAARAAPHGNPPPLTGPAPIARGPLEATYQVIFFIGLLLLYGLPFHLGLRSLSQNEYLAMWKEDAQAIGMVLCTIVIYATQSTSWKVVWSLFVIFMAGAWLQHSTNTTLVPSLEGILLIGGGVATGLATSLWIERKAPASNTTLALLAFAAAVFTAGVLLNEALNLTYYFRPEQEAVAPWWALREGLDRARFTMDSPMGAGQFLWVASLLLAAVAASVRNLSTFLGCSVLLGGMALAVLKTGSRGPYMLLAGSHLIFWALMVKWGNRRVKRTAVLMPFIILLIAIAAFFSASTETRRVYSQIVLSSSDSSESSNALRLERIHEGFDISTESWPTGVGLFSLPLKYQLLRINFESHPLGLLASLGLWGALILLLQYSILFLGILAALKGNALQDLRVAAYFSGVLPFIAYSFVFPIGQERYTAILMWVFIGGSLGVMARAVARRPWPGTSVQEPS